MSKWNCSAKVALSALAVALASQQAAQAQSAEDSSTDATPAYSANQIVVTARKRAESDLKVPIAISAVSEEQLDRYAVAKLYDLAAIEPSLTIAANFGTQGGGISLRGISTAPLNAASEQSVGLNFDGVTINTGAAIRFAQFDLARIEVLKGPQSLYFGKNTTAGIISIIAAEPTDTLYAKVRAGYEFNAREYVGEAVISGPIAGDAVKGRLALYYSDMEGWLRNPLAHPDKFNIAPTDFQTDLFGPLRDPKWSRLPNSESFAGRLSLTFEPSDNVTLRLKGTYGTRKGSGSNADTQQSFCAAGEPAPAQLGNIAGAGFLCGLDNDWATPVGQGPTADETGEPLFRDGQSYTDEKQYLLQAMLDVDLTDNLSLNSTTGYYKVELVDVANPSFAPFPAIGAVNEVEKRDFTQEIRLESDFDSPFNFMVGGYYANGRFDQNVPVIIPLLFIDAGLTAPESLQLLPGTRYVNPSEVWAGFGNISFDIIPDRLNLSAGGRYTSEKKTVETYDQITGDSRNDLLIKDSETFNNFNPEITLTWTPTNDLTIYGTWKRGNKSGGFNDDTLWDSAAVPDISYEDESVKGFEGGIKSVLAGGALRLDLAAFIYDYSNLQVGFIDSETAAQFVVNAASAKLKGIEMSANYSPPDLPGLTLSGNLNWNEARYTEYFGVCYTGQTFQAGCAFDDVGNPVDGVTQRGTRQDFADQPLIRAPEWTGSLNAAYEAELGSGGTALGISVGGVYTSSFQPVTQAPPTALQKAVFTINSQVRLFNDDSGWELALIGNNLTNEKRLQIGVETLLTPGVADAGTGSATVPGTLADIVGFTNRPRQIMLRATYEFQ